MSEEVQHTTLEYLMDTYTMHTDVTEGTSESGYIGLTSKYNIHEITILVKDPSCPLLLPVGLPGGVDFMTIEQGGLHDAFGHRQHMWKWLPIDQTAYNPRPNTVKREKLQCCCGVAKLLSP